MFGQKSKNQKEEEEKRKKKREGGRKKCQRRGRKKKSKPAVGADGPIRFPGRRFFGIFRFFFVIRTQDSILLNLNPNGHIIEAKMEISLFNQILLMNSDQLYLPKFSLSLFISNTFALGIAPLLELVFFQFNIYI